jgi:hypothetical protein
LFSRKIFLKGFERLSLDAPMAIAITANFENFNTMEEKFCKEIPGKITLVNYSDFLFPQSSKCCGFMNRKYVSFFKMCSFENKPIINFFLKPYKIK